MADDPRHQRLREDLRVAVTDVYPTAGTILIVHPRQDVQFTPEYTNWLAEELRKLLPNGVKAMVLAQNVTRVAALQPPEGESTDFIAGWVTAIEAVTGELT